MKTSDFSIEGTHGFLGLKYRKELGLHNTQRTPNYQELDRSESGLRFNSKCVGVAKNGGGANVRSRLAS